MSKASCSHNRKLQFFKTIFEVTEYQRVTRNDGHKNAKGNYEEVVDTLPAYIYLIYD